LPYNDRFHFFNEINRQKKLRWDKADKLEKWREDCTQIVDNVFIDSATVANNADLLRRFEISHSINCASHVVTSLPNINALDISMNDGDDANLLSYVWTTTAFIDDIITNGGKILVHCVERVSRSFAIILGFLILTRHLDYTSAFRLVRERRRIASPHPKFIAQLLQLAEILGCVTTKTCFFSKERVLPFEVIIRGGVAVAIPLYSRPELSEERTFVIVDFQEAESLYKGSGGNGGTLTVGLARYARPEIERETHRLADHLTRNLNLV
jgi:predicted protein tyrosine phosphatase